MPEFTIVLGLVILVTIIIMNSRKSTITPCKKPVKYFDKMYYRLPTLMVEQQPQFSSLNDTMTEHRLTPAVAGETNTQSSRWSGGIESQPLNDLTNKRMTTNEDVEVTPFDLQSGLKLNPYLSSVKKVFGPIANFVTGTNTIDYGDIEGYYNKPNIGQEPPGPMNFGIDYTY